jgi:hypothetical protein
MKETAVLEIARSPDEQASDATEQRLVRRGRTDYRFRLNKALKQTSAPPGSFGPEKTG